MKLENNISYDKIIIGGGASGMMAAIYSGINSYKTLVIEANDMLGKKLYATGNGKCNFTNMDLDSKYYLTSSRDYVDKILGRFDNNRIIEFMEKLGIVCLNRNGYIYPNSEQAKSIVVSLKNKISSIDNIDIIYNNSVSSINISEKEEYKFIVRCKDNYYKAKSVIVACGSSASPYAHNINFVTGFCKDNNIDFNEMLPALVPLIVDDKYINNISGVRQNGKVSLLVDGQIIDSDFGNIQFTDECISGIPIFQISLNASRALKDNRQVELLVDFTYNLENFNLENRIKNLENYKAIDFLNGLVNSKLSIYILHKCHVLESMLVKDIDKEKLDLIKTELTKMRFNITKTANMDRAQTAIGGVSISNLNENLEVNNINGLYFIGEIVDITGKCGGYNLQFAWTSGYIAGGASI